METHIYAFHPEGWDGQLVRVQVDIRPGLPAFDIIGLAGSAVREARERVRCAIQRVGFAFPGHRILINLHPADIAKDGASYDLALALAVLGAAGQVSLPGPGGGEVPAVLVLGELGLDGEVHPGRGILAALAAARSRGIGAAILPRAGQGEARGVEGVAAVFVRNLGEFRAPPAWGALPPEDPAAGPTTVSPVSLDHLRGVDDLKVALAVVAAGAHHAMVVGPPGVGKTLGAQALASLWPPLGTEARIEVRRMHGLAFHSSDDSAAGLFRMPHHSASTASILGGGNPLGPGELSLAHRGVLVLDEAPQFSAGVLQGLREPLEAGRLVLSRAGRRSTFPARATVLLTMNPCPCGNLGRPGGQCLCSMAEVHRYWARLGAPLLDRLDIRLGLFGEERHWARRLDLPLDARTLGIRVARAREMQEARGAPGGNGWLQTMDAEGEAGAPVLEGLAGRGRLAVWRVARTLADLRGSPGIGPDDWDLARELRGPGPRLRELAVLV